ncbi:ABC transporter substrate-binding protein [Paenibacillus cremeus]|nr:extracellular solute-binding protein [Paenibacillus cremeus]
MKKRMTTAILSLALLAAGCSSSAGTGTSTGEAPKTGGGGSEKKAEQPAAAKVSSEPVELVVFSSSGDSLESFNERFGNAIAKKFPNYKINYIRNEKGKTLPELLAAGQVIDIYFDSIRVFIGSLQYDMQLDMDDLVKSHNVDLSNLEPTALDGMRKLSGGKLWGIPVTNSNMALYYNKDIFNKFGVPLPKDGMTWDEVLDLSKKLTRFEDGKQFLGLGVATTQMLSMTQQSLPIVDPKSGKSSLSDDRWKKMYSTLYEEPAKPQGYREYMKTIKGNIPNVDEFHNKQNLGMLVYLSSYFQVNAKELKGVNWDMVSVPTFKDMPGVGVQPYPGYFSVTKQSKHKDDAMEVIKYLISDEVQMQLSKTGTMSALKTDAVKKAFGEQSEYKDHNLKAVYFNKFAEMSQKTKYDNALQDAYFAPMKQVASGDVDINTALRQAEEVANKKLDEEKKK